VIGAPIWALLVFLLLYEPVLVSATGGTLGHRWSNLHVVSERTGGNIGLGMAYVRLFVKGVLGIYSFLSMTLGERPLAIHDMASGSTVQIRDLEKSEPLHRVMGTASHRP